LKNDREPTTTSNQQTDGEPTNPLGSGEKHPNPKSCANQSCRGYEKKHPLEWGIFILLFFTLLATAIAACYTKKQSEISADTEKRQLRAFVGIDYFRLECPNCGEPTYVPSIPIPGYIAKDFFVVAVRNSGVTPARKLITFFNILEVPWGASLQKNFIFPDTEPTKFPNIEANRSAWLVPPNTSKEMLGSIFDARPIARAQNRTTVIYIYGHIDYVDIFDVPQTTIFCYRYEPWVDITKGFYPCDIHNDAT
jgi:hypothetical protein